MARRLILGAIRAYQVLVSPLLPPACRFVPTCSEYAATAVRRFGPLRGGWLALRRLLRCQPFGGRGADPVPPAPPSVAPSGHPTSATPSPASVGPPRED